MKAVIIEADCTGCGLCPSICPDVFELENDVASVKTDPVPENLKEDVLEAAESCPTEAIKLTD
jgi:ferredoxin